MARSGADLALLLLGGFRLMVDTVAAELSRQGFDDVRPAHEFALRAIAAGATNASELGRRVAVSKQAAAKTVALLQQRGYVSLETIGELRRKRLVVTPRGFAVMQLGEAIFQDLRTRWEAELGDGELEKLEAILAKLVGSARVLPDMPGWVSETL
ncbi:MAG: MarR family winged helix-turn-helix transcriptional regulator [Sphingobium sp.]